MKLAVLSTALFAALAPAAFAATETGTGLTATQIFEIRSLVPTADLSNLTDAQVLALADALHHGETQDQVQSIRGILN
jgi:hypothetical protein